MRTFDIRCHNHGDMYDVMLDAPKGRVKMSDLMGWTPRCPICDQPVTIIVPPVLTVGPMESKPIDLTKSVGRKFTSNAQWREYQKQNLALAPFPLPISPGRITTTRFANLLSSEQSKLVTRGSTIKKNKGVKKDRRR